MVDVIVTERGIAVNPKRPDVVERLKGSVLPLKSIEELHDIAIGMTGQPRMPEFEDRIVALIEFRDGTVIDTVRQLKVRQQ
jgi:citrate lyase subunit alpha/citrate CoA-transferase